MTCISRSFTWNFIKFHLCLDGSMEAKLLIYISVDASLRNLQLMHVWMRTVSTVPCMPLPLVLAGLCVDLPKLPSHLRLLKVHGDHQNPSHHHSGSNAEISVAFSSSSLKAMPLEEASFRLKCYFILLSICSNLHPLALGTPSLPPHLHHRWGWRPTSSDSSSRTSIK